VTRMLVTTVCINTTSLCTLTHYPGSDESYHVCHKGYLSIFPLMLSLLSPTSPHVGAILDIICDPEHLWSPYGIRSLSASHPEFGQGENYWKGPIWIQMNYLVLSALHKTYGAQEGPYQQRAREVYADLRKNVIDNVFKVSRTPKILLP